VAPRPRAVSGAEELARRRTTMTRGRTEEEDGWGAARAKRRCGVARSPQPFFRDPLYFSDDLF
jgi:hypothetical protein